MYSTYTMGAQNWHTGYPVWVPGLRQHSTSYFFLVFALAERKNQNGKMKSTMLPQAKNNVLE